jgi:hypothetical protein
MAKKSVARKRSTTENVRTLKSPAPADTTETPPRAGTMADVMPRREAEFYRRQAERLQALAGQCADPDIRDQIANMAKQWVAALAPRKS